ncbi:MAG: repeat protein [Chitinophagaceae bacterium]|nr:repeat protein [Chitinophagaceae bacterium]
MLGYLNLRIRRQYVIDELINMRRNFSGELGANLSILYERFGLKQLSLKKLRSEKWHLRARGIQELYVMEQRDMLDKFYDATNDENEFVRMEAQTGIIHMLGFNGLEFLNHADYYITEWQQLKILQQLDSYEVRPSLDNWIQKWLRSENNSVVLFAIRLSDHYQLYSQHDNLANCLHHENENIRIQAACSLAQLANENTADILVKQFPKENSHNKIRLLDAMETVTTEKQKPFLIELLVNETGVVKLKAARVLAVCCPGGLDYLEEKAQQDPVHYKGIFLYAQKQIPEWFS